MTRWTDNDPLWSQDERDAFYAEETQRLLDGVMEAIAHSVEASQAQAREIIEAYQGVAGEPRIFGVERHSEEWYEIEVSAKGADDWFATNERADTRGRADSAFTVTVAR